MKKLSLAMLSKHQLTDAELRRLRGGNIVRCGCGCACGINGHNPETDTECNKEADRIAGGGNGD
jgi:natural product precursor